MILPFMYRRNVATSGPRSVGSGDRITIEIVETQLSMTSIALRR
jgi:hypothetical protein